MIPLPAAHQVAVSLTIPQSRLKFMSIESVMLPNHLILFPSSPLSLIFPSIRIFFSELALYIRWPKYWSFSFSISPSNEYSELISFRTDWFDLLAVQATLKSPPAPWFESTNSSGLSHVLSELFTTTHPSWMALHGMAYSFIELQALSPQQDCDS